MSSQSEVSQRSVLLALVFSGTQGTANMGSYTTAPGKGSYPSSASMTDTGGWRIHGTWGHHTKAQTLPWKFVVLHSLIVSRVWDPQRMKIRVSGLEWGLKCLHTGRKSRVYDQAQAAFSVYPLPASQARPQTD